MKNAEEFVKTISNEDLTKLLGLIFEGQPTDWLEGDTTEIKIHIPDYAIKLLGTMSEKYDSNLINAFFEFIISQGFMMINNSMGKMQEELMSHERIIGEA